MCAEEPLDKRMEELRRLLRNFVDPVSGALCPLRITDSQAYEIFRQSEGVDAVR